MRYAHINPDGLVVNVSLWDGETPYDPPEGHTLHQLDDDSPVGPGWEYDGIWTAPPSDPAVEPDE
jgi:hypothetical protein